MSPDLNIDLLKAAAGKGATCPGLVFRGFQESYFNYKRGEYTYKERMRLLKKKSCPGCENCGPTLEMLDEDVAEDNFPIIDKIKHGALYTLQVVNITRDWESGTIDGWDHAFVEIEEEKKKDGE